VLQAIAACRAARLQGWKRQLARLLSTAKCVSPLVAR
jgi:hypothetical protein